MTLSTPTSYINNLCRKAGILGFDKKMRRERTANIERMKEIEKKNACFKQRITRRFVVISSRQLRPRMRYEKEEKKWMYSATGAMFLFLSLICCNWGQTAPLTKGIMIFLFVYRKFQLTSWNCLFIKQLHRIKAVIEKGLITRNAPNNTPRIFYSTLKECSIHIRNTRQTTRMLRIFIGDARSRSNWK